MVELPVEALEGGLSIVRLDDGRVAVITSTIISADAAGAYGRDLLDMAFFAQDSLPHNALDGNQPLGNSDGRS
jgi:hypothetical protein